MTPLLSIALIAFITALGLCPFALIFWVVGGGRTATAFANVIGGLLVTSVTLIIGCGLARFIGSL